MPNQPADTDEIDVSFLIALTDDFKEANRRLEERDNQYARRTLVRAAFAAVEGQVFALKQSCLRRRGNLANCYTQAELAFLREESYGLNNKGDAFVQTRFVPLLENIKFMAAMTRRGGPLTGHGLNLSGPGWQEFKTALAVRNRLTHPKSMDDLIVTDDEMLTVLQGYLWFLQSLDTVITDTAQLFRTELSRINAEIERVTKSHGGASS